jgi:hypothetical protein
MVTVRFSEKLCSILQRLGRVESRRREPFHAPSRRSGPYLKCALPLNLW